MEEQCKYYDIIDRKHLEVTLIYSKRQIAFGVTAGPNSFTDGKMNNLVFWFDFLFWCIEIGFKFNRG
jgi:hypothetical protein